MSNLRYFGWSRPLRLSRALSPTPTCESEIYDSSVPNSPVPCTYTLYLYPVPVPCTYTLYLYPVPCTCTL